MTIENLLKKIVFFLIAFIAGSTALAILGIFSTTNLYIALGITIAVSLFFSVKNFIIDKAKIKASKTDLLAVSVTLALSFLITQFHHDFSRGRDEMVHLISAANLVQTEGLLFEDTSAESFSGLTRTNNGESLTPQFLPAYITTLGLFYKINQTSAIPFANALLMFIGLLSVYFTGKHIRNEKVGIIAITFLATLYTTLWFSMRLNSEILFFPLFWTSIWFFLESYKREKASWYFLSYAPLTLLLLTRGEGLLYVAAYLIFTPIILIKKPRKIGKRFFKKRYLPLLIIPLTLLGAYVYYLSVFNIRYITSQIENFEAALNIFPPIIMILGALFLLGIGALYTFVKKNSGFDFKKERQRILLAITLLIIGIIEVYYFFVAGDSLNWKFYRIQFTLEMMTYYMISFYILLTLLGLFKKQFKKHHLYITILSLPSFIFLIESNIAPDQPWFMRRYIAVFIPLIILLASDAFQQIKTKYSEQKIALYVAIIALNIIIALPIIGFVDNKGMEKQISQLSDKFTQDDVILLEPGWNWQKWTYPMRFIDNKKVIANNNSPVIDQQKNELIINLTQKYPNWKTDNNQLKNIKKEELEYSFEKIKPLLSTDKNAYILTENPEKYAFYAPSNLEKIDTQTLSYTTLKPSTQILHMIQTDGSNLSRKKLRTAQKNTPPREKEEQETKITILQIKNPLEAEIQNDMTNEEIVLYRNFITTLLRK